MMHDAAPPSFEDFRGTIELLDRRSKAFIQQATDLIAELRRFGLNVQRINRARLVTQLLLIALGGVDWRHFSREFYERCHRLRCRGSCSGFAQLSRSSRTSAKTPARQS